MKSQWGIATAGKGEVGRSKTIHLLHCSELAFWPDADVTMLSLLQAVPDDPKTMVFEESTPNGIGNRFYRDYQAARKGESASFYLFIPWFEHREYSRPLEVSAEEFADSLDGEERQLREQYTLTLEQLYWRRWCVKNKCGDDSEKFKQEYPSNDVECFLLSGRPRFDPHVLTKLLSMCSETQARGYLVRHGNRISLDLNSKGYVRMWKPPEPRKRYVIGGDVAEGLEKGDYCCDHVYDRDSMELVCELHGHIEPERFGEETYNLGRVYNDALVGVEANNHGLTTLMTLRRLGYPRIYYRKDVDSRTKRITEKIGWRTDTRTRPLMIDGLSTALNEGAKIRSKETVEELMTFVVGADGKAEAQEGCFDDRVIASAIAVQMHKQAGLSRIFSSLN